MRGYVYDVGGLATPAARCRARPTMRVRQDGVLIIHCTAAGPGTLVLVHKAFLVEQWRERVQQFLPDASVGMIKQDVADGKSDVVIGMVQSLSKRNYPADLLSNFGTVVVDEAHHMSAPVFNAALSKLPAKHVLGLSATPERKDGLTPLLYHSMGPICFRAERPPEYAKVSVAYARMFGANHLQGRPRRISLMLNAMAKDQTRNDLLASHVARHVCGGRFAIVLTDRLLQLDLLKEMLLKKGVKKDDVGYYVGATSAQDRATNSQKPCILSTYCMAKEGLDIPRLDTLVLATPKSDVVQAVGRIQRFHCQKSTPLILDVVDPFSMFRACHWKRQRLYKSLGFECQAFDIEKDEAPWFA